MCIAIYIKTSELMFYIPYSGPLTLESLCTTYILEKILLSNGRKIESCAKTLLQSNEEEEQAILRPRRRRSRGVVLTITIRVVLIPEGF